MVVHLGGLDISFAACCQVTVFPDAVIYFCQVTALEVLSEASIPTTITHPPNLIDVRINICWRFAPYLGLSLSTP
jgi:hypothetical protein